MTSAIFYCSVLRESGLEGGKIPVIVEIKAPE
jgi:hypothetical protein